MLILSHFYIFNPVFRLYIYFGIGNSQGSYFSFGYLELFSIPDAQLVDKNIGMRVAVFIIAVHGYSSWQPCAF